MAVAAVACIALVACQGGNGEPRTDQTTASPTVGASADPSRARWFRAACDLPVRYLQRIERGYVAGRSADLMLVPREPNAFGSFTVTTHAGPWDYLARVPLVFYGPGFIRQRGEVDPSREVTLADIAPTVADLLEVDLPHDRAGHALTEALVPRPERGDLKMILTVVWDAGGWNALDYWPQAWPYLRQLMQRGTSFEGVTIGSSPSVTPPIHATLGTGTFPRDHGLVDINIRTRDGVGGAFEGTSPKNLQIPTLASLYDERTDNRALIGMLAERAWHLGMIGHGAYLEGGDKDHAILLYEEGAEDLVTNPDYYELPEYLYTTGDLDADIATVDAADGVSDGFWMGNAVLGGRAAVQLSPAGVLYQTDLLKALWESEGYGDDAVVDLFYTNFKQIDEVSHVNGRETPEMREVIGYADRALRELVAFLNREVGRNSWTLAVTADHGQGQLAEEVGGWPISMTELLEDIGAEFDLPREDSIEAQRPSGFWLNQEGLAARGISAGDIADFLLRYDARSNLTEDVELPDGYAERTGEKLFDAVVPTAYLDRLLSCARN